MNFIWSLLTSPITRQSGSTRVVCIVGPLVIKTPHYAYFFLEIKDALYHATRSLAGLRRFGDNLLVGWIVLRNGIHANWTEFMIYYRTKAPFLVPVVSCGFFSIQLFEEGEMPTLDETRLLLHKLYNKTKCRAHLEPHDFLGWHNWRKNKHGMRMIDYGDKYYNSHDRLSEVLIPFHQELTELCASMKPATS